MSLLRRVVDATGHLRYSGMRTVEFSAAGIVRSHTEYVLADGRRSRVDFPSDSAYHGQVIVDDGKQRLHYFPGRHEVLRQPSGAEDAPSRVVEQIVAGRAPREELSVTDGGLVAGRSCREVSISNRRGVLQQNIWVDPDTGMVLKREVYTARGERIADFEFERIDYKAPIRDDDFKIQADGAKTVTPEDLLRQLQTRNQLRPVMLAAGSGSHLQSSRELLAGKVRLIQAVYLAKQGRVVLFQGRYAFSQEELGKAAPKDVSFYTWSSGGEHYALVGKMDEGTLRRLAQSVQGA